MPMNDLDSLFESVRGSAIADVIRDSKIILVTEFDAVHPLKTGEFWFEEESNTLYVGAGQVMEKPVYVSAVTHNTGILYIPAPRTKTSHTISTPKIAYTTSVLYKPTPRTKTNKNIVLPNISKHTNTRIVTKNNIKCDYNVLLPIVMCDTIIEKI